MNKEHANSIYMLLLNFRAVTNEKFVVYMGYMSLYRVIAMMK